MACLQLIICHWCPDQVAEQERPRKSNRNWKFCRSSALQDQFIHGGRSAEPDRTIGRTEMTPNSSFKIAGRGSREPSTEWGWWMKVWTEKLNDETDETDKLQKLRYYMEHSNKYEFYLACLCWGTMRLQQPVTQRKKQSHRLQIPLRLSQRTLWHM